MDSSFFSVDFLDTEFKETSLVNHDCLHQVGRVISLICVELVLYVCNKISFIIISNKATTKIYVIIYDRNLYVSGPHYVVNARFVV